MFNNNLLMGAASAGGESLVEVGNSAFFDSANSESLSRTFDASNRRTWTFSTWLYRGQQGTNQNILLALSGTYTEIRIQDDDKFRVYLNNGGSAGDLKSAQVLRDIGWYHLIIALDTTQALASNRCIMYINGERVSSFTTENYPTQNLEVAVNTATSHSISASPYLNAYLAETVFIDGLQLTPTSFGQYDSTGTFWTPLASATIKGLTFGTNGFYLDNTTNAQTDASGEGNNFTNNNTVTTTSLMSPTQLSRLLWNPLSPLFVNGILSNGNTTLKSGIQGVRGALSNTAFPTSGKWQVEMEADFSSSADNLLSWGIVCSDSDESLNVYIGENDNAYGFYARPDGNTYYNKTSSVFDLGAVARQSFKYQICWDASAGNGTADVYFGIDNTFFDNDGSTDGNPATGANPTIENLDISELIFYILVGGYFNTTLEINDEADWEYGIQSGYTQLNLTNVAAQTTRTKSNLEEYFDSTLYEGNGAGQRVGKFLPFTNAFTVGNGALFAYENNEILKRTNSSGGNETKWTFSTWVKFNDLSAQVIMGSNAPTISPALWITGNDLYFTLYNGDFYNGGGSYVLNLQTTVEIVDTSQWMNIVAKYDSTPSTPSSSSIALYINGVQVTNFITETYPSQNQVAGWNSANEMLIGTAYNNHLTTQNLRAYLAETVNIDGLALEPSSFGQVDTSTGRWIPKDVSGLTFGTNGFYLNYANSSDVGNDVSGRNNDWTNINTVTQVGDTPTVNSNVWNPSESGFSGGTFTNGNRTVQTGSSQYAPAQAGLPISSGKWYTEVVPTAKSSGVNFQIGITKGLTTANTQQLGSLANDVGYYGQGGELFYNGESGSGGQSYGASYDVDDVIGMAIDFDANTITFYKNGASQGVITLPSTTTASTPYFIACNHYDNSSNGTFLLRSLSSDWTGSAPTGHLAIIQDNMPEGESYQTAWSWIKNRDATDSHMLFDRVRGIYNDLHSDTSDTEVTNVNTLQRFLNGGVQVGNDVQVNTVNESYVAWNWYMEATGSGSALTSGSINTTALVDTNLGVSVGTYSGSGSAGTIETGLTNTQFIIVKRRDSGANWASWHVGLTDDNNVYLDVNNAQQADGLYDTSSNTSTLIAFGGGGGAVNAGSGTYSFIAFAPSQFTSIGSYKGNGNANGSFVPTINSLGVPIQPAWVMIKRIDAANNWCMRDIVRDIDNPNEKELDADLSNAEITNSDLDIVTGGFKLRATDNLFNNSSGSYIYLAFGTPIIDVDGRIITGR